MNAHKKFVSGWLLGLALFGTGTQVVLLPDKAFAQTRIAADNSIQVANSHPNSFEVKKTVTFTLSEPTEVFARYDLGQSHGCCADHVFGDLRIFVDGIVFRRDHVPFVNYGVQPISAFLEDFDYFFPSQVVMGLEPPVSSLDPRRVGPLLQNYKRVNRQGLGNLGHLAAGSHTFELELGDAGWNSIFEIYSELPQRPIAPDATAFGPLPITSVQYKFGAAVFDDVLIDFNPITRAPVLTELWARVYMPANLDDSRRPLLVFLHGVHDPLDPNHEGYGYLAERLASWGYVVVSINGDRFIDLSEESDTGIPPPTISGRGRLVLKHLQKLSEWNTFGSQSQMLVPGQMPGVELKDKLDFTQVGLFGHSVGGEAVRAAYNLYQADEGSQTHISNDWGTKIPDKITFQAIFEIGPTDGQEKERLFDPRGVKWSVLLPICDGDNYQLPGVKPFDRMIAVGDPIQKSTFTVWGANHNAYNTAWWRREAGSECAGDGNLRLFPSFLESGRPPILPDVYSGFSAQPRLGAQQRQTALASVMAFFRGNVGRNANPDFNQIFNPEFGLPLVVSTVTRVDRGYTNGPARVFEDFGFESPLAVLVGFVPFLNTYGFPNDIRGITMVRDGIRNNIPDHNVMDVFGHQTNRPAGLISWEKEGGFFQTNWTPRGQGEDISQFQTLEFRVSRQCRPPVRKGTTSVSLESPCFGAPPLLHPLNLTEPPDSRSLEPTNFAVRLVLGDNTLSEPVQLTTYTDLVGPVGRASGVLRARLHPILQTVRIPLADFRIPLTRVRGVRFTFDSTPTGAIYMSDIRVSRSMRR